MSEILLLLSMFVLIPALKGYVANVRQSPRKRVWYYRNYLIILGWTRLHYSMLLFFVCTLLLYAVAGLKMSGLAIDQPVGLTLLLLTGVSGLWYLRCYFEPRIKWMQEKLPWKPVLAVVAVAVATLSKVYTDQLIAELTNLPARDLPNAQVLLSAAMNPALWFAGLTLLLTFSVMFLSGFLMLRSMVRDYFSMREKRKYDVKPDMTAIVAMFMCVFIFGPMMEELFTRKNYETWARQAIAFATLNLPASYCGLSDLEDVTVAPLANDTAALAIPDEVLGYRFETIACTPQKKSQAAVIAQLRE
ncbi:hypothetical protein IRZ70_06500 [Pseudomonas monteilii]|nr:hypothetical protein [Pseudomonas monteilii]